MISILIMTTSVSEFIECNHSLIFKISIMMSNYPQIDDGNSAPPAHTCTREYTRTHRVYTLQSACLYTPICSIRTLQYVWTNTVFLKRELPFFTGKFEDTMKGFSFTLLSDSITSVYFFPRTQLFSTAIRIRETFSTKKVRMANRTIQTDGGLTMNKMINIYWT